MTDRAIVIGASIGGLLAARVLADHYGEVLVIDKDHKADGNAPRKGVPQGEHIHLLWSGGLDILEKLFPGLTEALLHGGATAIDNGSEMRWYHHGVWKLRQPSGLQILSQSRPLLERTIRERVEALPAVSALWGHRFRHLLADESGHRIVGVELETPDGNTQSIDAGLVIDASGRSGATLRCLEQLGFELPAQQEVGVDIGYATQEFEPSADATRDWKAMAIYSRAPDTYQLGVIFPIEDSRWIVTLAGLRGRYLKENDNDAFLDYARALDQPHIADALADATPVGPVRHIRYKHQLLRDFASLDRFPTGYLPFADMICSLNPMYGQGMTVCAKEAEVLSRCLGRNDPARPDERLSKAFFKGIAPTVNGAWLLGCANDFLYHETTGKPPPLIKLLGWYVTRVLALSDRSGLVMKRFLEVVHFQKPITALLTPGVIGRVLFLR